MLELGKPIERQISPGQRQRYTAIVKEGQYFEVIVESSTVKFGVVLTLPTGKVRAVFDIPMIQTASVHGVAEQSGKFTFEVYTASKSPEGSYRISLTELRLSTEKEKDLQQARTLVLDGIKLNTEGKYLDARPMIARGLEIRERILGPDDIAVANTLGFLATTFDLAGDYSSAEKLWLRALKIKEKIYGPDNPEVAQALLSLASTYRSKGDDPTAEKMLLQSLGIFERTKQTDSILASYVLGNLGDISHDLGDLEKADSYFQRSLAIREKILGDDNFHLASSLSSIGHVALEAGDYPKAEGMFRRSLLLTEKRYGPDQIQTTGSLNDLATLYASMRDFARVEEFYLRTLSIYEHNTATGDPRAQETLFGLARIYASQNMLDKAMKFQSMAGENEERYIRLNLPSGSEREKLAFLATLSSLISQNISLHFQYAPDDSSFREMALTTILRRKGRVQDMMSAGNETLIGRLGSEDRKLIDQFNDVTGKLANLVLAGKQKLAVVEYQERVKAAEAEREGLESELSRRSEGYFERSTPVTIDKIREKIPNDATLVEFAVYRAFDPTTNSYGDRRYAAYVLQNQGEVKWKNLGDAKTIDAAIDAFRTAVRDPKRTDVTQLARALDEKIMQPVRGLIGDTQHLLISPDGALNLVPFEALVDENQKFSVERYSISYLTSGRDLIRMGSKRPSKSPPLVIADPAFGEAEMGTTDETVASRKAARRKAKRGSVTSTRSLSDTYFARLAGTAQEAESILGLFPDATSLTGANATEASLKSVTAPKILHIATHGFFLQLAEKEPSTNAQKAGKGDERIENPLLRSGLALAGANQHGAGAEDGILTAMEASGLNLWGTKLVVLSACDTGLGELHNGEGVYGLRRSFVIAGAESLVMSMWPVSDQITRELMANYYKNLKQGLGRGEALRQVQLEMLKRPNRRHPFYWASFIQTGEWANLDGKR